MTLSYQVLGLKTGFYYQFKVQSVNTMGSSEMSPASLRVITALVPGIPTGLTLKARSSQSLTFEWQSPADNGGAPLISYYVYQAIGNGAFQKIINSPAELNPSITVNTENNLSSSQNYRFKVSAVNIIGESTISPEIFVIAANLPQKP